MTTRPPTSTVEESAYPMWRHEDPDVVHLGGPARVYVDDPAPEPHRPVGFTADVTDMYLGEVDGWRSRSPRAPSSSMPLLWDGDQA